MRAIWGQYVSHGGSVRAMGGHGGSVRATGAVCGEELSVCVWGGGGGRRNVPNGSKKIQTSVFEFQSSLQCPGLVPSDVTVYIERHPAELEL